MIRDYKFQRTEWTLRKKRKLGPRLLLRLLLALAVAGIGYAVYQWSSAPATSEKAPQNASGADRAPADESRFIPLELPPGPAPEDSSSRDGAR